MKNMNRIIMINQVTGPLFQDVVLGIYKKFKLGGVLITGSTEDLKENKKNENGNNWAQ